MEIRLPKLGKGEQGTEVPAIPLFPAAYVKFRPKVPLGATASVYLRWEYAAENQPKWFPRFKQAKKGARFPSSLDVSGPVRVYVPARISLELRFNTYSHSSVAPKPNEQILNLAPGETKDMGLLEFVPRVKPKPTGRKESKPPLMLARQSAWRQRMVLGPVIERVVNHTGDNCLINFDTGTLVNLPKEACEGGSKTAIEWARKNGIDAGGGTQPEVQGLIGFDIIALPVDKKVWSLSGDAGLMADKRNVFAVSTPGNPVYLSAKGGVPATYKFQTREGGLGVL